MKARRNGFASGVAAPMIGAAALIVVALVAVIGSAQAAPSTKNYGVHGARKRRSTHHTTATVLTLTLTNGTRSKQTLGSANFTPPRESRRTSRG